MSDRRERIPAEEVPDPKRWKLPFWTEPKHIIHAEEELEEDDSDVVVEDEEIEIEPLTADQLESIRQEAYNEGLEQGLIEGRQKGEKLGFEEGKKEGLIQGKEEGSKQGYEEGLAKGEKTALDEGESKSAALASQIQSNMRHLESAISEQTSAIEKILPELVIALAQAVISEELDQGSEHIVNLVQQALNALPTDSKGLTIECNSLDLPFLEAAQEHTDFEAKFKVSSAIQPGGCKVSSQHSSIDFTQSERWHLVLKQYHQQLQLGLSQIDDIQQGFQDESESIEAQTSTEIDNEPTDELTDEDSAHTAQSEPIKNEATGELNTDMPVVENSDQNASETMGGDATSDEAIHSEHHTEQHSDEVAQSEQQDANDALSEEIIDTKTDASSDHGNNTEADSQDMNPPEPEADDE